MVINAVNLQVKQVRVVGFYWDMSYGNVSNTHDSPINGETNWGGRDSKCPTSYPGYNGRVWIRYSNKTPSFGSDGFRETLTYTGTGGFGIYNGPWAQIYQAHARMSRDHQSTLGVVEPQIYSWDYRFFEDDWPGIKSHREKQDVISIMLDQSMGMHKHDFSWDDPDQLFYDQRLINLYQEYVGIRV